MSYTKEKELMDSEDILDEEFEKRNSYFYDNYDEFVKTFLIPDAIAFYIANAHSIGCLSDSKLYNHINSAIDIFNCRCDIDKIIPMIELILKLKYNLKITQTNPLKLEKYF